MIDIKCTCNAEYLVAPNGFHEKHCAIIQQDPTNATGVVETRVMTTEEVKRLLAEWQDVRTEDE